jgi:hypothetical protein
MAHRGELAGRLSDWLAHHQEGGSPRLIAEAIRLQDETVTDEAVRQCLGRMFSDDLVDRSHGWYVPRSKNGQ